MRVKKPWIIIPVVCLLLGGGGFWAMNHFKAEPQQAPLMTASVMRGDVKQTITATGTVRYPEEVPLAFEQTGTVKEIYVEDGDKVTAGQILARLDTETLQQELTESQAALKEAELTWEQQRVEAEGSLIQVRQKLRDAERKADAAYLDNQVYIAEQNVKIAGNKLAAAQQKGDREEILQAQSSLAQAQKDLEEVQADKEGDAAQEVELAKADLAIAEARLSRLAEKTSLAEAETNVVRAQEKLAQATLVASADGVIIEMKIKEGQTVTDSSEAITLATGGDLLLIEGSVSQSEVAKIKAGQKVEVTLDSALDEVMEATVTKVATKGTSNQSVTTFTVTMQMNQPYEALLAGMNANVAIIIAEAKDVLMVPSLAIQTQGEQKGVMVVETAREDSAQTPGGVPDELPDGVTGEAVPGRAPEEEAAPETSFVPVEVGVDDGINIEIKSGLTEGQEVMIMNGALSSGTDDFSGGGRPMGGRAVRMW